MRTFRRILVANRGEIAVRIIRACRDLGLEAVAVFSDADRDALHVRLADRAYRVGPAPAAESYLRIDTLVATAREAGCDAVHPGYGFLAENADFAEAVTAAGLVFIGPSAESIRLMGDKTAARRAMAAAGVPTVPGTEAPVADDAEAEAAARRIGFPLMIKAAAGGGGKGMRLVERPEAFASALRAARSEATSAFGDGRVYLERFIERPRHVEIQVMGDGRGGAVHLFERECSIQRRHQKVIEESPSPALTPAQREAMGEVAVRAVASLKYAGAGTLEFLLDQEGRFYFLEMNTRLQVEHPVTEWVTGVDLVRAQIEVAAGGGLPWRQADLAQRGWSIECRVYAEDPAQGFMPSPGRITALRAPAGPGVRDDSGVYEGFTVPIHYDPLISKVSTWGPTRDIAIDRMRRALREYVIGGITTNIPFHLAVLDEPEFRAGRVDTGYIARVFGDRPAPRPGPDADLAAALAAAAAALDGARNGQASCASAAASGGRPSPWRLALRQARPSA
ncbi:MAG TPA: acetyl-CoA carboxylase biotin carboxylase subunit [Thermodesulfobacteriota bacterium]